MKGERVGDMQDLFCRNFISVTKIISKERVKVYMGKPKGLLKVLWELVSMGTSNDLCTYYTLRGQYDNYGNTIIETILRELMRNYLKFIQETLIKTNACKMGERREHILVNHNLKCYPNISGEGIEYSWGCAKINYRQ